MMSSGGARDLQLKALGMIACESDRDCGGAFSAAQVGPTAAGRARGRYEVDCVAKLGRFFGSGEHWSACGVLG
jgi:hypothetical protein